METLNLLDVTIKYFNVIVFVMCVVFGMISVFASWIAWREIHRKKNIIRSVVAAYNIAEDTLEKGRTSVGDFEMDPAIVQTVFNSLQEVLNAVYGELTGKLMPSREERLHGSRRLAAVRALSKVFKKKDAKEQHEKITIDTAIPTMILEDREHHRSTSHP